MTDNINQAISISRQMLTLTQQFVVLEIFDFALKATKDGDKDKFPTILKALNDCEKPRVIPQRQLVLAKF